jgi:hypothetical protein
MLKKTTGCWRRYVSIAIIHITILEIGMLPISKWKIYEAVKS